MSGGIPIVLTDNGAPATVTNLGMPVTIVGATGTTGVVQNDQDVPVYLSSGFNAGTGNAQVSDGHLTGVALPAGTGVVSDGQSVIISKADNTGLLATSVAHVDANDEFENVALPQNYAVIQDGIGNFDVADFGSGQGAVAVIARVSNNNPSVQLANATTKIAINAAPITIADQHGRSAGATIAVDQGAFQNFPLTSANDTLLTAGSALAIFNNGVTSSVAGTFGLSSGTPRAILPASTALVGNGIAMQVPVTGTYTNTITAQVNAGGVITGFTLS